MTEENNNVVSVRFKPLTSVEEYLKILDEIKPDDILSMVFKEGEVHFVSTTMEGNVGLASLHVQELNNFLVDLYYTIKDEERE